MYSKGCLSEPSDSYTGLRVACERHSSQSVTVIRIVVSGVPLATH